MNIESLRDFSDRELNEFVGKKIGGWTDLRWNYDSLGYSCYAIHSTNSKYSPPSHEKMPDYCNDANAIIKLLEKYPVTKIQYTGKWLIEIVYSKVSFAEMDDNFCRAACYTMLSAYYMMFSDIKA